MFNLISFFYVLAFTLVTHAKVVAVVVVWRCCGVVVVVVDGKAVICGFRPAVNLCRVAEINKYYTLGLSAGIQFS